MHDDPPRPKPKPGSRPLPGPAAHDRPLHPAQYAEPPFGDEHEGSQPSIKKAPFGKLKAARKKADDLAATVRDAAFDQWVATYLVHAERPDQWTRSRELYENYLKRAVTYGENRRDRSVVKLELATETRWGRMMGSVLTKQRRSSGWYYPVRLKRGA